MPSFLRVAPVATAALVGACLSGPEASDAIEGAAIEIGVNQLSLPDATDVLYDLSVSHSGGTVWSETAISSNDYGAIGASGSWAYIGPCDADASGSHTVTLTINDMVGLAADEWVNPGPLTHSFTCTEDTTSLVAFDVTVAIDGDQGFSDISVDFGDIFCSAHVDCENGSGDDLMLVQDAAGTRIPTAVLSLNCTAGNDTTFSTDTALYMNDIVVDCGGATTAVLDPTLLGHTTVTPTTDHPVEAYVVNQEELDLTTVGESLHWSVSIGLDDDGTPPANCALTTRMTASEDTLTALTTPASTTYPVIDVDVALTDGTPAYVCSQHPIEGGNGVEVQHTSDAVAETFQYEFDDGNGLVLPLVTSEAFSATSNGNCAVGASGNPYCWGQNAQESTINAYAGGDLVYLGIAAAHAWGLKSDGTIEHFGNTNGGRTTGSDTTGVAMINVQAGNCWALSDGTIDCASTPTSGTTVNTRAAPALIKSGTGYACALRVDGTVDCWGSSTYHAMETVLGTGVADFSVNEHELCMLFTDGTFSCSGDEVEAAPAGLDGDVVELVVNGDGCACAVQSDDTLTCWGAHSNGFCAGIQSVVPASIPDVVEMSMGNLHLCALDSAGNVSCYGAFVTDYATEAPASLSSF